VEVKCHLQGKNGEPSAELFNMAIDLGFDPAWLSKPKKDKTKLTSGGINLIE